MKIKQKNIMSKLKNEILLLKKINKIAEKYLRFYAYTTVWDMKTDIEDFGIKYMKSRCGGKKAIRALAKIKKLNHKYE